MLPFMADLEERVGGVPRPAVVAAWLVLGGLPVEDVPMWAAWWLVEGFDGEALRNLAGLSGRDPFEVSDMLPDALGDMGVQLPSAVEACRLTFTVEAARCLRGAVSEEFIVALVERIVVATGYARFVYEQPLGALYGMDDEWGAGWGRRVEDLRLEVRAACHQQVGVSPRAGSEASPPATESIPGCADGDPGPA